MADQKHSILFKVQDSEMFRYLALLFETNFKVTCREEISDDFSNLFIISDDKNFTSDECPVFYLGENKEEGDISSTSSKEEVINFFHEFQQKHDLDLSKNYTDGEQHFVAIPIDRMLSMNCETSLYVRLSETKFVKIRQSGDSDLATVNRYKEKGIEDIYISQEEFSEVLSLEIKAINEKIELSKAGTSENVKLNLKSIEAIHSLVKTLGINDITKEDVDNVLANITESIKGSKLKELVKMLSSKSDYLYTHAYLASFISYSITKEMDWQTSSSLRKIVMASLFHNIALESDEQAKIYSLNDQEFLDLPTEEKGLVKRHGIMSAMMLEGTEEFSPDIKNAIMNHHEKPNGEGFPRNLGDRNVSSFDAVFIISVNFAHDILKDGSGANRFKMIIDHYSRYYASGQYEKPCKALLKVFLQASLQ